MSEIPKFKQNNVAQCWSCKNRDGSAKAIINSYRFLLPYCPISNAAMVQVYDNPCRCFDPKEEAEE